MKIFGSSLHAKKNAVMRSNLDFPSIICAMDLHWIFVYIGVLNKVGFGIGAKPWEIKKVHMTGYPKAQNVENFPKIEKWLMIIK